MTSAIILIKSQFRRETNFKIMSPHRSNSSLNRGFFLPQKPHIYLYNMYKCSIINFISGNNLQGNLQWLLKKKKKNFIEITSSLIAWMHSQSFVYVKLHAVAIVRILEWKWMKNSDLEFFRLFLLSVIFRR